MVLSSLLLIPFVGSLIVLWLIGEKLLGAEIGGRPLLLMGVLSLVTGVQLFCFGLLAELQMRTYHESQNRPIYRIRQIAKGAADL